MGSRGTEGSQSELKDSVNKYNFIYYIEAWWLKDKNSFEDWTIKRWTVIRKLNLKEKILL